MIMDNKNTENIRKELFFLVAKFLESGPCSKAFQALKEELSENKLIPRRFDWEGRSYAQSYEELCKTYRHIGPNHLFDICLRVNSLLDKEFPPNLPYAPSLLGIGGKSLLKTARDKEKTQLRLVDFITRRHQASISNPISCLHHNIVHALIGRETSGPVSRRHAVSTRFYNKITLLSRVLGHLSAVYCILFDRTGRYIITGADDLLIKVWSAIDGRLLSSLRGSSAEITDIDISIDNILIAAGSLDRLVRVWCLQTGLPVVVLTAQSGMITGVNFCPNHVSTQRYLVSTSSDGSVAFWNYLMTGDQEIASFNMSPVIYNEKIRPGQAQMNCASFSPGGMFLATGSADHHVRVYLMHNSSLERILEEEKHTDRVDTILWANRSLTFLSGSKDGTAIIWKYKAQQWTTLQLFMTTNLPGKQSQDENKGSKLKVTMVSWNADDSMVITAVSDSTLKIWDPKCGKLLNIIKAHEDVVYVLENHPLEPRVLLSAGHDGVVFLWDLYTGDQLMQYQNHIEGQGNGALFDAKWSPDGTMIAATDTHGHLLMFGLAYRCDKMKNLPKELFFHTDYRPLTRDSRGVIVDEQTHIPPHLMPPPFLVDMDGNPYPPIFQKLVPGRHNCADEQLIPTVIMTASGQQEVLQVVGDLGPPSPSISGSPSSCIPVDHYANKHWQLDHGMVSTTGLRIPPLPLSILNGMVERIGFLGKLEIEEYEREKKKPLCPSTDTGPPLPLKKSKKKQLHNYRTRAAREQEEQEGEESESMSTKDDSDASVSSKDMGSESSSSDSSSTEYSDWIADHGVNLEPPQRSRRRRPKKAPPKPATPQINNKKPIPQSQATSAPNTAVASAPISSVPSTTPSTSKVNDEIPPVFRPSEWLSEVVPKKFPYYPQMGDEVMFFEQGYLLYLKAVENRKQYEIAKSQYRPWGKLTLKEPELVKVIGIKYELRPPRLCCLRLAVIRNNAKLTGDRFTIKYHDIPDVIDFLVLKQTYDTAVARRWTVGDRFRSMIDDAWWWGTIEARRPETNSLFLCHDIRWDNGEVEKLSPWDMEPVDPDREPDFGHSVPVLPEEIASILYHPNSDEWPGGDQNSVCERILAGLEEVMSLSVAEPFNAPVDITLYPSYFLVVEFPIDLSTIKARLENRFYRRLTAAQFDIRYLATNTEKFNEPHSNIVKQSRIVTDLCLSLCKEQYRLDVLRVYHQLLESYQSSNSESDENEPTPSTSLLVREKAAASRTFRAIRRANQQDPNWQKECTEFLELLWKSPDSVPFRKPVDRFEHPDYYEVIACPMDLGTIREDLRGCNFSSPYEFFKALKLVFSNSRNYNTNKRSKIYVMTVRLSAMVEEYMKIIISNWRSSQRKQNRTSKNSKAKANRRDKTNESESESSSDSEVPILTKLTNRGKRKISKRRFNCSPDASPSEDEALTAPAAPSTSRPIRSAVATRYGLAFSNNTDSNDSLTKPSTSTASSSGSMPVRKTRGVKSKVSYRENSNDETSDEDEVLRKKSVVNGHVRVINPAKPPAAKNVNEVKSKTVNTDINSDDSEESSSESSHSESDEFEVSKGSRGIKVPVTRNSKIPNPPELPKPPSPIVLRVRKRQLTAESESDSSDGYIPSISTKISRRSEKRSRPRRSIKRMNYSHNSDEEVPEVAQPTRQRRISIAQPESETSESESSSESDQTPKISISSRGRVRKLMPHVRAFLRE